MIIQFPRKKEASVQILMQPASNTACLRLPLYASTVAAGFPTVSEDYLEGRLDLHHQLVQHPKDTFVVKVSGDSMIDAGIHPGDLLIVDRSLPAENGKIVIAAIDGELTVKRLCVLQDALYLMPENPGYPGLEVLPDMHFKIWGVVTSVIHSL